MIAHARYEMDRTYFERCYDATVRHRLKYRRYARPLALAGLALVALLAWRFTSPQRTALLGVGASLALYSVWEAFTHRSRWLKPLLRNTRPGKWCELTFHDDHVDLRTDASSSALSYAALVRTDVTPAGLFLVPESGVHLFVPRESFDSRKGYEALAVMLVEDRPSRTESAP